MADFTALKTAIQNAIKQNGNEEITGNLLQEVLLAIVTTLGDGSINDLITALGSEATTRQQGDSTLQGGINTAMQAINAINNAIGNGCAYAGIATPSTIPAAGKVFYLALTAGTYTNFNGLEVSQGINILKNNGSTWSLDSFVGIDDAPAPSSQKLVKSGGVFDEVMKNGSAFDLSAYNGGATYADLNAALTALNALPAAYKRGGMSMKFVLSSDNKYVQFRLMSDSFSTTVSDWQGVDSEPTAGSENLVKSGGTFATFSRQENGSSETDLDIEDEKGNIIARYHDGIHETKYPSPYTKENSRCDISFEDKDGNAIFKVKDGYPETKNFDGKEVAEFIKKNNIDFRKLSFNDALNATADLASEANSKKFFSNYEFNIVNTISIPNPNPSLYVANRMASIGLVNNKIVIFISRNFLNPANSNTVGSWITYDTSYNVIGNGWIPTPQYIQSVAEAGNYILRTDFICCVKDEINDILYFLVSHYACISEDDIVDAEFTLYKTTDGTTMEYVKSIQSPVDDDGNIVNLGGTIGLLESGKLIVPLYEFAVRCSGYMEIPLNSPLYYVYMNKKETGYTPNECVVYKAGNDIVVNARCDSAEHRRIFVRHNSEWYPYYDDVECKGYACYECWIKNGPIVYRSMTPNVNREGLILYGSCFNGGGTTPILTVDAAYGGYSSMAVKDNTKIYLVYEGYFDGTYRTLKLVEIQATPKNNNPSVLW